MTDEERIATLEAEVAELRGRLPPVKIASAPAVERGVRISYPREVATFTLPNESEMAALQKLALAAFPCLVPAAPWGEEDRRAFDKQFAACFSALGFFPRTDRLNTNIAAVTWVDRVQEFLRSQGTSCWVTLKPFVCAAIAWNDVGHSVDPSRFPYDLAFALANLHASGGRSANADSWKRALSSGGQFRPATEIPSARMARSPVTIRYE